MSPQPNTRPIGPVILRVLYEILSVGYKFTVLADHGVDHIFFIHGESTTIEKCQTLQPYCFMVNSKSCFMPLLLEMVSFFSRSAESPYSLKNRYSSISLSGCNHKPRIKSRSTILYKSLLFLTLK